MPSRFDSAIDAEFGSSTAPVVTPAPKQTAIADAIDAEFGAQVLPPAGAVLRAVADQDPVKASRSKQLAQEMKAPQDVVARHLMDFEIEDRVRKADSWLQTDPQVMQRFRESPMFAAQAQKDVEALIKAHGELKGWKVEPTVANTFRGLAATIPQAAESVRLGMQAQMSDLLEGLGLIERDDVETREFNRRLRQSEAARDFTTPEFESGFSRGVYGGADSLLRMLPGLAASVATRNPAFALGQAGAQTQAEAYVKYRARDGKPLESFLGATAEGAVEVATELLPMKFLADSLGKKGFSDFMAGMLARDIPTEQVATLLQDAVDTAVANPGKTWTEYLNERPGAAYETLVATMTQTGAVSAINTLVQRLSGQAVEIENAATGAQRLQAALLAAGTVQLRTTAPGDFAAAMQAIAAEDPDAQKSVFMDAATLMQLVPNAAELFPSVAAELQPAAASGASVELPIGQVLAQVPGSPLEQVFLENARPTADGLSLAEARAAQSTAAEWFQRDAQRVIAEADDVMQAQAQYDQIKGDVVAQLNAAGRTAMGANEQLGNIIAAGMVSMAARLGRPAIDIYNENRLTITNGRPATPGAVVQQVTPVQLPPDISIREMPDGTGFEAVRDGKVVGRLTDNLLRGQAQQIDEDANVDIVKVDPSVKGQGVGSALYAAFAEKHQGRIAPSGKTTRDAWAVWKRNYPRAVERFAEQEAGRIQSGAPQDVVLGQITDPEVAQMVVDKLTAGQTLLRQTSTREANDTRYQERAAQLLAETKAPKRASVGMFTGTEKVPKLATNFDIARFFTRKNRKGMESWPSASAQKAMVDALYAETLQALTDAGSAVGWYDGKVSAALASVAEIHPEIATDEQSKFGFITMLAITSNSTAVNQNFEVAEGLYRQWKETGVWPTSTPPSKVKAAMDRSLEQVRDLVAQHGWQKVRDFMVGDQSVAAVKEMTGSDIAGELADSTIYGAVFLGSKIGAFFNNLYGNFTPVTMDRWFMRTINRLRGNMLRLPSTFAVDLGKLREQLADPALDTFGVPVADMLAEIDAFEALSADQQADVLTALDVVPSITAYSKARLAAYSKGGFRERTRQNVLAKTINEGLTLDEQTPNGGSDRAILRGVMKKLQDRLRADGIPIDMADLQAVLWYYEKDLFDLLKGKRQQPGLFAEGDQDAEDYATAADRLVRLVRGEGADRPGSARPGAGPAAGQPGRATEQRADTTGDLFQRGVNDARGTAGNEAQAGGVRDGRGVRGGDDAVADNGGAQPVADAALVGLPATVRVDGREVTFGPFAPARRAAEAYAAQAGIPYDPPSTYAPVDAERATRIAQAFEAMEHNPNDPEVAAAYAAMINETLAQWQAIKATGLVVEFIDGADPYGNPRNAILDVTENNHLWVYPTDAGFGGTESLAIDITGNPLLAIVEGETISGRQVRANDIFRIVHDYFGHIKEGVGFRAEGEENAWRAHWAMFSPLARKALTTETRGQNSWVNFGPYAEFNKTANGAETQYAPQKIGLLPDWVVNEGASDADSAQAEQRRMRQTVDLAVLQSEGNEAKADPIPQTETDAFKAWFGDSMARVPATSSKQRFADQPPLVLYHTTRDGSFTEFEANRPTVNSTTFGDVETSRSAIFFTATPEDSAAYGQMSDGRTVQGATMMPVYLQARNPLWVSEGLDEADAQRLIAAGMSPRFVYNTIGKWEMFDDEQGREVAEMIRAAGYDSVVFNDQNPITGDSFEAWAVFAPTQIKSAIGNAGTFNSADANILRQRPGSVSITGTHFSKMPQSRLDGRYYGTGLRGIERERIANSPDTRLRNRVYFYVDEGKGVRPEAGVGGAAHTAEITNLYDINSDPLKLIVGGDLNATETNVLNAGFDGYYRRDAFNQQGAAVVLGDASRNIAVTPIPNPTTAAPPVQVAPPSYSYGLLSREAAALDMAAIQAVAPTAQLRGGNFRVDVAELDAARAAAAGMGVTLPEQRVNQGDDMTRGTFNIRTMEMVLTESADLSTFIHESGHFYLELLAKYGAQPTSPADVRRDAQAVMKWFGIADLPTWNAMSLEEKRPYHERWAESFEQYMFEGKAPTKALEPAFRKFSAFMKSVYGSIKNMLAEAARRGSDMSLTLNDEIRGVFDRMLAADAAVQEAEARIGGPVTEEATADAVAALEARSLRDMKWAANARSKYIKKLQAQAKDQRKEVKEQVAAEVAGMPEVRARKAIEALRVVPEHQVLLDQWREARKVAEADALRVEQEAALAAEVERTGVDPAGLKKGQFLAKTKREVKNAAERRMIDWDRANPKPLRPVNTTDQDLATIADSFGYPDAEAMMTAIRDFGREADVVDAMTDQRMLEEFGDLVDQRAIEEAANKAVHNEARARALANEMVAEAAAMNPREDTGRQTTSGARITVNALLAAAKQFAASTTALTLVRDLRARRSAYDTAERKAAERKAVALRGGQTAEALKATQDQLVNNQTSRSLGDAIDESRKMIEFLRKVLDGSNEKLVERGRDPDVVNAMRAVLFDFGVGTRTAKSAAGYLDALAANDAETATALKSMVEPLHEFAQPIEALTFGELKELHDAMQAMWYLSRQMRQMEVDGEKIDVQDAADELSARLQAIGVPLVTPGTNGSMSAKEQNMLSLRFWRAALTRVEQWAMAYGPEFTKYVFGPIKVAADRYRADRTKYRKAYIELLKNIAPALKPGKITAPELGGFVFGNGPNTGHSELLHAILHTGNESNKRKLLLGRGWATENADGTLDTTQWDAFVTRMQNTGFLRKEHYDFAQAVWDMLEEIKPLAQRAHREVYGRYFDEVTANSFETPFGTYKGGYVPAQASLEEPGDRDRAELNNQNEALTTAFPSAPRGFTKSRTDYNTKLSLNLGSLGTHMDQVLRFSHMQPAVRGVNRLLKNKTFSTPLNKVDDTAVGGLLLPWLNRAARQSAETPINADGRAGRIVSVVRARAGMGLMMGNLLNAVQQLSGFINAAVPVRPSMMVQAAAQFAAGPKQFNEAVRNASIFMQDRMANEIGAINEAMDDILLNPTALGTAQAWTMRHAYFLQAAMDNTMSPIIWTAAYNQAMARGETHDEAVRGADEVIRTTQTSTLPEDISRAESGSPLVRLFTQFANYFNMLANTNIAELVKLSRDGGLMENKAQALYVVFTGLLLPIWFAEGVALAMRGGPEDEDEDGWYWDDWIAQVVGFGTVKSLLAAVPGIGQIVVSAMNRFDDNPLNDRASLSPVVGLLEAAGSLPYRAWRLAKGEDTSARGLVNDSATAITLATGLPVRPLARPASYLTGVASGEIEPTGAGDFLRGLLTGAPSPESRE